MAMGFLLSILGRWSSSVDGMWLWCTWASVSILYHLLYVGEHQKVCHLAPRHDKVVGDARIAGIGLRASEGIFGGLVGMWSFCYVVLAITFRFAILWLCSCYGLA